MTHQEAYKAMLKRLGEDYEPLACYHLNKEDEIMLSDSVSGKCRFCGKSEPEVTFDKVAHAIPHFIGNRTLKSTYECDSCNGKFSALESNFSQFMSFYHTFAHVSKGGGAKVPKFRTNSSENSSIEVNDDKIEVKCYEGEGLIPEIDEENNTLTLKTFRSYVPQNVYKIFIKMALTIMPEKELSVFQTALKWLNGEINISSNNLFLVERRYMSTKNPFDFVSCMLFKRKEPSTNAVPAYIFGLAYYNFFFQTYIPLCDSDKQFNGQTLTMPYIPTPLDDAGLMPKIYQHNMSSAEKVSKEEIVITLKAERMEEVDLSVGEGKEAK